MTNEILTQDEIDSLLRGVQGGIDTNVEIGADTKDFNFYNQERIIRGRMPGLENANERFARAFRNSLSTILRRFVDVNIQGVAMVKFGDLMKTLPLPSNINIFRMKPLMGLSLFIMEAPTVFAMVECFFGGNLEYYVKAEGRYFTAIEQKIIRKIIDSAFADMATAWSGIISLKPEYVGNEINPQFVTIVQPAEIVIKVQIDIEIENFHGRAYFGIPYSVVEPLKEKISSGFQADRLETDDRWVGVLKDKLYASFVGVTGEMGRVQMTIGDILALEVGDIINLGTRKDEPITVRVQDVPKFAGVVGQHKGNQAIKILEAL
ncbi:MAG: flagellar motor switch protein FliM [Syntrophorhabdaceae bacterium]|nr:flagellar motor switch protein FliM [Syntrophorhabdaceae bacterium]